MGDNDAKAEAPFLSRGETSLGISVMDEEFDEVSMSASQTFSLEVDTDVGKARKYPSVSDYYAASGDTEADIPLQLQSGLSNYSGLKLGDDRITVGESVLSATYRIPVEHKMAIKSPSKGQTKHTRKREYEAALAKVGESELNRLERVMKDKLFQRSYATSSPFQVRKAFKFFDRETTLRISIEGFTRALEFLGFQFAELQNLALFARYDKDVSGEIDYMYFISEAMFYAAIEPDFIHSRRADVEPERLPEPDLVAEAAAKKLELAEVQTVFNKVDQSKSGTIPASQLELLLMALGYYFTPEEITACITDMGGQDGINFGIFSEWWTEPGGFMTKKKKNKK